MSRLLPVLGVAAAILAEACSVGLLSLSGWFIASSAAAGLAVAAGASSGFSYLAPSGGVRSFALGRVGFNYLQRLLQHRAALARLTGLRLTLFDRLAAAPPEQARALRDGELLDRTLADAETVAEARITGVTPLVVYAVIGVAAVGVLGVTDAWAAAALGAGCLGAAALAGAAGRRVRGPDPASVGLPPRSRASDPPPAAQIRAARGGSEQRAVAASLAADRGALRGELVAAVEAWPELAALGAVEPLRQRSNRLLAELSRGAAVEDRRRDDHTLALGLVVAAAFTAVTASVAAAGRGAPAVAFAALLAVGVLELAARLGEDVEALRAARQASARLVDIAAGAAHAPTPEPAELPALVPGGALVVAGRSGAGKTTLLHAIALRCAAASTADVTFVPHDDVVFTGTVLGNLRLARPGLTGREARALLDEFGLDDVRVTDRVGVGGRALSGGEQRRLHLARAVLAAPEVLIVDEPTTGMDEATAAKALATVRARLPEASLVYALHEPRELPGESIPPRVIRLG